MTIPIKCSNNGGRDGNKINMTGIPTSHTHTPLFREDIVMCM